MELVSYIYLQDHLQDLQDHLQDLQDHLQALQKPTRKLQESYNKIQKQNTKKYKDPETCSNLNHIPKGSALYCYKDPERVWRHLAIWPSSLINKFTPGAYNLSSHRPEGPDSRE